MTRNPSFAPRGALYNRGFEGKPKGCRVCMFLVDPADATARLYDEVGDPIPPKGCIDYLIRLGMDGTRKDVERKVYAHRKHIDAWLASNETPAPAQVEYGISRIEAPPSSRALDVNQGGIDLGMAALGRINARLSHMEDTDLIAVAKLGQNAASARITFEMKGAVKREELKGRLASGYQPAPE